MHSSALPMALSSCKRPLRWGQRFNQNSNILNMDVTLCPEVCLLGAWPKGIHCTLVQKLIHLACLATKRPISRNWKVRNDLFQQLFQREKNGWKTLCAWKTPQLPCYVIDRGGDDILRETLRSFLSSEHLPFCSL